MGALLGPIAAAAMLRVTQWPIVILTLTLVGLPALVAVYYTYPDSSADPLAGVSSDAPSRGLLPAVLRLPVVLLGATMLSVYVGLEIGVGNWGYGFLVGARGASDLTAGWTVSAYWLGLTLGRFVVSVIATRLGLTKTGMASVCLAGVVAAAAAAWLLPTAAAWMAGFVLLGFFLGPVFPTTMAVMPDLTEARLAPTAMGVMNAGSVVGGSLLPWVAGALGEGIGVWTLLPWTLLLAVVQLLLWWRMVRQLPAATPELPVAGVPAGP